MNHNCWWQLWIERASLHSLEPRTREPHQYHGTQGNPYFCSRHYLASLHNWPYCIHLNALVPLYTGELSAEWYEEILAREYNAYNKGNRAAQAVPAFWQQPASTIFNHNTTFAVVCLLAPPFQSLPAVWLHTHRNPLVQHPSHLLSSEADLQDSTAGNQ